MANQQIKRKTNPIELRLSLLQIEEIQKRMGLRVMRTCEYQGKSWGRLSRICWRLYNARLEVINHGK